MLIVCSGEDSFRVAQKARELEEVFVQKYDPRRLGVHRLETGHEGRAALLAASVQRDLFSPKQFFLATGLLSDLKEDEVRRIKAYLEKTEDGIIVLSLEDEWKKEDSAMWEGVTKVVTYEFPLLQGSAWIAFAQELAKKSASTPLPERFLQAIEGDGWRLWNELERRAVFPDGDIIDPEKNDPFALVDAFFDRRHMDRGDWLEEHALLLSQGKVGLKALAGEDKGIHPYVVKKWKQRKGIERRVMQDIARLLQSLLAERWLSKTGGAALVRWE